jgi:SAM-dependent methyltransferase
VSSKYDGQADRWTEQAYADPSAYLAHLAALIVSLGPPLQPGDTVLDLACGDAGLAEPLLARGLRYYGVDLSESMAEAARRRLGDLARIEWRPERLRRRSRSPARPAFGRSTTRERRELFRHIASYTVKKLVFDLNPRQFQVADVRADLEAAGLTEVVLHPFLFPQRVGLPRSADAALRGLERSGLLARALLRARFSYLVAASRAG